MYLEHTRTENENTCTKGKKYGGHPNKESNKVKNYAYKICFTQMTKVSWQAIDPKHFFLTLKSEVFKIL